MNTHRMNVGRNMNIKYEYECIYKPMYTCEYKKKYECR